MLPFPRPRELLFIRVYPCPSVANDILSCSLLKITGGWRCSRLESACRS